jgi:hypothetical protein
MNTIRTAARRYAGMGWKAYDQQFRLCLAADPTGIRFDRINYKLLLLFIEPSNHNGAFTGRVQPKHAMNLITIGVQECNVRIGTFVRTVHDVVPSK